jgi:hypothetical protein
MKIIHRMLVDKGGDNINYQKSRNAWEIWVEPIENGCSRIEGVRFRDGRRTPLDICITHRYETIIASQEFPRKLLDYYRDEIEQKLAIY